MSRPTFEHVAIYGSSQTGKSTLCKLMSRRCTRRQYIYDPIISPQNNYDGWKVDTQRFFTIGESPDAVHLYSNPYDFMNAVLNAEDADIYVDEAADIFTLDNKKSHSIMTQGRHRGLKVIFTSQRPRQIAPTVRNQASLIYLYRMARTDADNVLRDAGWDGKELKNRPKAAGQVITMDLVTGKLHNGFYHPEIPADA